MDVVGRNLTAFRVTVDELTRSVTALLEDLEGDSEQVSVANDWYSEKNNQISDFIEKTVRWISSAKEVIEENLEVRSRAGSRRTQASHRSHTSSRSSITTSKGKHRKIFQFPI